MLYWDHAASTPPYDEVIQTMAEVMKKHYGNPSSIHRMGEDASKLVKRSREVCAKSLAVQPSEIVFTSGATEGNNLAIKGAALQYRNRGKHIITTAIEHPSVYESCQQLKEWGYELTVVPVSKEGTVDPAQIAAAVRKDTILVSVMHVNNETGAIQPLERIGRMVKDANPLTLFHVDGVQGFGKCPIDLRTCKIDLFTISAHKIGGPKGVGLLYIRNGVQLVSLMSGGEQEQGIRSGTENIPAIVAMAKAVRMSVQTQPDTALRRGHIRDYLIDRIEDIPELVLNSSSNSAPHIVHFCYPGMKSEVLLHALEEQGMLVSTKSACSSKKTEPSRVLLAMGHNVSAASSGIRISIGDEHTLEDARRLADAIVAAVGRFNHFKKERYSS